MSLFYLVILMRPYQIQRSIVTYFRKSGSNLIVTPLVIDTYH